MKDGEHHNTISEEELLWGLLPARTDGGQPGLHMTLHHSHSVADEDGGRHFYHSQVDEHPGRRLAYDPHG